PSAFASPAPLAAPLELAAAVKVSVPPVEMVGPEANRVALLMLRIATLVMLWLDSLAGPVVRVAKFGKVTNPAFSTVVTLFEARLIVGAWFTGNPVMV